jgi:hypothetical protein
VAVFLPVYLFVVVPGGFIRRHERHPRLQGFVKGATAAAAGAIAGAALLQTLAVLGGAFVRGGLRLTPLRLLDSLGGLAFGAATGLVIVWVLGASALLMPGQTKLRHEVQQSALVRRLDEAVPPRRLLHLLARIDPFPSIAGPPSPAPPR